MQQSTKLSLMALIVATCALIIAASKEAPHATMQLPTTTVDATADHHMGGFTPGLVTATGTPPGGANTDIQFNNAGAFGGSANLTWDGTGVHETALGAFLATGGTPALSGALRLTNCATGPCVALAVRNSTNTTDVALTQLDLSDIVTLGGTAGADKVRSPGPFFAENYLAFDHTATLPSVGLMRLPYNALGTTHVLANKDSGGTDRVLLDYGPGDQWTIGTTGGLAAITLQTAGPTTVTIGSTTFSVSPGAAFGFSVTASAFNSAQPIVGMTAGNSPYGVHARADVATGDSDHILTAAEYGSTLLRFADAITATRTHKLPTPADAAHEYWKIIDGKSCDGNHAMKVNCGDAVNGNVTFGPTLGTCAAIIWCSSDGKAHLLGAVFSEW